MIELKNIKIFPIMENSKIAFTNSSVYNALDSFNNLIIMRDGDEVNSQIAIGMIKKDSHIIKDDWIYADVIILEEETEYKHFKNYEIRIEESDLIENTLLVKDFTALALEFGKEPINMI